jgi:AcrR family transcriptional regulator
VSPAEEAGGRANQRRRTRKDLLEAASRLMREGRRPSLEEVAEAALVSRATAYRYFPSIEALLREAALHVALPAPETLFGPDAPADPLARVERLDAALEAMIQANEAPLRLMLASALERVARGEGGGEAPVRQDRRTPLIEAALAPARGAMSPDDYAGLKRALAMVMGTEAMVVCKDVLQLSDDDARDARRWAIRALLAAAVRR